MSLTLTSVRQAAATAVAPTAGTHSRRGEGCADTRAGSRRRARRRAPPDRWRARRCRCGRRREAAAASGTPSTTPRRERLRRCAGRPAWPSPRIRFRRRRCRAEDEHARHRSRWRACSTLHYLASSASSSESAFSASASSISASASAVWASAIASSSALTSSTDLLRNRALRLFRLDRSLRRRCRGDRRGLLRRTCLARAVGLGRHRLLPHQLDDGHRGVVALTCLHLDDAGVAAGAVGDRTVRSRRTGCARHPCRGSSSSPHAGCAACPSWRG